MIPALVPVLTPRVVRQGLHSAGSGLRAKMNE